MNFLFVCDDEKIFHDLSAKLVLLRKDDKILRSSYKDAINNLAINRPDIVLVCECTVKEDVVNLVKTIKNNTDNPVILISANDDQDFILTCFDAGIADFIPADSFDYEFVIRIINNIRFNLLKAKNAGYRNICLSSTYIRHKGSASIDSIEGLHSYMMERNRVIFLRRNAPDKKTFCRAIIFLFLLYGRNGSS